MWHLCSCVLLRVIYVCLSGWRQLSWMCGAVWDSVMLSPSVLRSLAGRVCVCLRDCLVADGLCMLYVWPGVVPSTVCVTVCPLGTRLCHRA